MTRKLTLAERNYIYREYCCCFCGSSLDDGPRGAASVNMGCRVCGAVFNLIHRDYKNRYGEGISFFGELLEEPKRPAVVPVKLE